jgi:hypothetical protein
MADNHYDNYLEDLTLSIGKVQLKGFVSKKGIANFLNILRTRPRTIQNCGTYLDLCP